MTEHSKPNRLINEKSPYLLQHAHNPVDWHPWSTEAFERAEREFFLGLLEGYREGRVPLVAPLDVLRSWVVRFDEGYLAAQSFLEPYPVELLDVDSIVEACGDRDYWKDLDDEMTTD